MAEAPNRYHDLSIDAAKKTVKHGSYYPLDGNNEHLDTLGLLLEFTQTHKANQIQKEAADKLAKERVAEERKRLEADPVWVAEQQRLADERNQKAEEDKIKRKAEAVKRKEEQEKRDREERRREAKERLSKIQKLTEKIASMPAAGGKRSLNGDESLATCWACQKKLFFCSHPECIKLLEDSCRCRESTFHPSVEGPFTSPCNECESCGLALCDDHDNELEQCENCQDVRLCEDCTENIYKCSVCKEKYCTQCIQDGSACECDCPDFMEVRAEAYEDCNQDYCNVDYDEYY